jgi:ABC-2 type transport system permease protein
MTTLTTNQGPALIPVRPTGWRMGLGTLTGKEFGEWWKTKLWWIQTLVWVFILNGISTVVMMDSEGMTTAELMNEAVQTFFLVGATAIGIGIVLTLQGVIVGEKELGTAAWVMSKPASRTSFVVSKLIAHSVGFVVTSVVIPSGLFLLAAHYILPEPIPYGYFATGMAVMALNVLFYVTLTIALGCVFRGRGPIAGVGIALILVGQFFKGMLPMVIVTATPWPLGEVAASFPMQTLPEFDRVIPLIAVSIEIVALIWLALWRFQREEF